MDRKRFEAREGRRQNGEGVTENGEQIAWSRWQTAVDARHRSVDIVDRKRFEAGGGRGRTGRGRTKERGRRE